MFSSLSEVAELGAVFLCLAVPLQALLAET
jgi:hypothetical protein